MRHVILRTCALAGVLIFWIANRQMDSVIVALLAIWAEIADRNDKDGI